MEDVLLDPLVQCPLISRTGFPGVTPGVGSSCGLLWLLQASWWWRLIPLVGALWRATLGCVGWAGQLIREQPTGHIWWASMTESDRNRTHRGRVSRWKESEKKKGPCNASILKEFSGGRALPGTLFKIGQSISCSWGPGLSSCCLCSGTQKEGVCVGAFKSQPRSALRRSRMEPCQFLNSEAWGGVAHPSAELPQRRIPMWGSDSWFPGGGCLRGGDIALTCESALVVLVLTGPCLCPSFPSPSGLCFISLVVDNLCCWASGHSQRLLSVWL